MRETYFSEARNEIAGKNLELVQTASVIALISVVFFTAITPVFSSVWRITWQYYVFLLALLVLFLFTRNYRKKGNISYGVVQTLCSIFCLTVIAGAITIDVFPYPDNPASFVPIVQIILPTIFILKFSSILPLLAVSDFLYCILILRFKNPLVQVNDIYNVIVGLFFGILVAWIVMDLRVNDNCVKARFQRMSSIDLLTGILNKRTCEETIAEYLKKRDENHMCALMVMDIDNFKHVNDKMGHQYGDELLEGLGSLLTHTFRSSDIVGRIGGDEFVILLRNVSDRRLFKRKYNQLQLGMKKISERIGYPITCSAGFAVAGREKISFEALFEMADDALYEAKSFGKNRYIIHMTRDMKLQKDKPVLLIADDSEMNREVLKEIFQMDYELVEASDGTEALSLLSQYKDRMAAVLLDLHIPGMNGFEILRYINSRASYQDIPVMVITADEKSEEEALLLGATDMIRKPFEPGVVKLRVERILK